VIPEEARQLLEEVNKHEQPIGWLATAIATMTEARRRK
jgi:hypothetical protein